MSESIRHIEYVKHAADYVRAIVPAQLAHYILIDSPESTDFPPQMQTDAYRPDVYLRHDAWHIIGEAKTDNDCTRPHSICQYETYLKELEKYNISNSLLIISCSIYVSPTMSNMLRKMKSDNGYSCQVVILNELGKFRQF